jgi:hypothetical protein
MKHPLPPTPSRPSLCAAVLAVVFILVAFPAAAQTGSHGNNQAQAVLQIHANVVSCTMAPPRHHPGDSDSAAITYNLSLPPTVSVSEELREFIVSRAMAGAQAASGQVAVLRTLTVVPR